MDLGGHMVPRAEWATFGVPESLVFGGVGGGDNLNQFGDLKTKMLKPTLKLQSNKSYTQEQRDNNSVINLL